MQQNIHKQGHTLKLVSVRIAILKLCQKYMMQTLILSKSSLHVSVKGECIVYVLLHTFSHHNDMRKYNTRTIKYYARSCRKTNMKTAYKIKRKFRERRNKF